MEKHDGGEDFGALLEEFEKKQGGPRRAAPAVGALVHGRVMTVGREAVFVTLDDGKTEGMLDLEELRDEDGKLTVAVGDTIEARVAEVGDRPGFVVLRRQGRRGAAGRAELEQAFTLGLIEDIHLFRAPVVLGGGIPFFPPVAAEVPLELLEVRTFENGVVFEHYRVPSQPAVR